MSRRRASSCAEAARRLSGCERGAAAVEFALIVGLALTLIFGIFHVGRALQARNEMGHALSQAVRIVHLRRSTPPEQVEAALRGILDKYQDVDIEVEVTELVSTSYMRITVRFPYRFKVPFLPASDLAFSVETLAPMVSPTQG